MMRKRIRRYFTLLELLVSMGVFALLMLALMQYFSSAQNIWTMSNSKTDMYENAKIAMNIISADLMNIYYEYGTSTDSPKTFFLVAQVKPSTSSTSPNPYALFSSELSEYYSAIGFSTIRSGKTTSLVDDAKKGVTRIAEVIYLYDSFTSKLYTKTLADVDAVSSDTTWCTENNDDTEKVEKTLLAVQMAKNEKWNELISNVVQCKFVLLDNQMRTLVSRVDSKDITFQQQGGSAGSTGRLPYAVSISFTLLDDESIAKLKAIAGKESLQEILTSDITGDSEPSDSSTQKKIQWQIYHAGKQDFSRVVVIDRGQYN